MAQGAVRSKLERYFGATLQYFSGRVKSVGENRRVQWGEGGRETWKARRVTRRSAASGTSHRSAGREHAAKKKHGCKAKEHREQGG